MKRIRKSPFFWPTAALALAAVLLAFMVSDVHATSQKRISAPTAGAVSIKKAPSDQTQTAGKIKVLALDRRHTSGYAADRIMVKFKSTIFAQSCSHILTSTYKAQSVKLIPRINVYKMKIPSGSTLTETIASLQSDPRIEYAHPVYKTHICAVPNDTYFSSYQYNLYNPGGTLYIADDLQLSATQDADIKAEGAWDVTKGDEDVVIAILDTGVDMTHDELKDKVVSSGKDFVNDDTDATDDNFHGTHVAGIAAAKTNNNEGIAGVAWNCKILPVKVMDADGNGYYDWMVEGIIWAADNGAKVINMSLGGDEADDSLEAALKYAYDKGVVIVAAAGNTGKEGVEYPAAYDDYVLAVAATDYTDQWCDFSSYGSSVDVAAPGYSILSTAPQWYVGDGYLPYLFASGTSMATPQVSGLAALLLSKKSWLTPAQVMKIIEYTADDVNSSTLPGRDNYLGYGRINMKRALAAYKLK